MLLILIFILILIWASVVGTIYSNFLVFYSNFSESENYHKAYYNAIAALERAELVTKQRSPWYVWNEWRKIDDLAWTWINWGLSDNIISNFSYLSNTGSTPNTSTVFRNIKSRTSRIPDIWEGDIEIMLAANDSNNYNMMDYENAQVFLLYYDDSTWNPYTKTSCSEWDCILSKPTSITWDIRLPEKLRNPPNWQSGFDILDTTNPLVWTWPNNDAIVDRQVRWKYKGSPFTIYSKQNIAWKNIYYDLDSAFREWKINNTLKFEFSDHWSPFQDKRNNTIGVAIINPKENEIKNLHNYENLFSSSGTTNPQIRFSLLNLLKDKQNKLYPFLEYFVDFWTNVADKYYTINAEWNYVDYKVNIIIRKPTSKESVLWHFTTIF